MEVLKIHVIKIKFSQYVKTIQDLLQLSVLLDLIRIHECKVKRRGAIKSFAFENDASLVEELTIHNEAKVVIVATRILSLVHLSQFNHFVREVVHIEID